MIVGFSPALFSYVGIQSRCSVQLLSCVQLLVTPWTAARQAFPSIIISWSLLKLLSIESAIRPSHPLSSPSPPAFNLFQHRSLSNELVLCIRWPKYWSFNLSISPSNEYSGLISFNIDWFDLRGTLKSLLEHHSSRASILWCSAFFMVQLSHPYVTTGKTIALIRWILVGKVMSLLFNMNFKITTSKMNSSPSISLDIILPICLILRNVFYT